MNESGRGDESSSSSLTTAPTTSNDQKLAHFQEVTHLDDFDQCQAILESTNWDLDQAIQSYFTQMSSGDTNQMATITRNTTTEVDDVVEIVATSTSPISSTSPLLLNQFEQQKQQETLNSFFNNLTTHPISGASSISNKRLLTFSIEYLSHKFILYLKDSETVEKLKELIEEQIGVPRKNIKLNGWPKVRSSGHSIKFISDNCRLSELNLSLQTNLHVVNMQTIADDIQGAVAHLSGVGFAAANSTVSKEIPDTFELHIKLVNSGDEKINRFLFLLL